MQGNTVHCPGSTDLALAAERDGGHRNTDARCRCIIRPRPICCTWPSTRITAASRWQTTLASRSTASPRTSCAMWLTSALSGTLLSLSLQHRSLGSRLHDTGWAWQLLLTLPHMMPLAQHRGDARVHQPDGVRGRGRAALADAAQADADEYHHAERHPGPQLPLLRAGRAHQPQEVRVPGTLSALDAETFHLVPVVAHVPSCMGYLQHAGIQHCAQHRALMHAMAHACCTTP